MATKNNGKKKKGLINKKKVFGFDLNDKESRIYFDIFAVLAALMLILLIVGFVLGFSKCGSPEIPEETDVASAADVISYTDIADVTAAFDSADKAQEFAYNYSNDVFKAAYDPEKLSLQDTYDAQGTISISDNNAKATRLTVTKLAASDDTAAAAYLERLDTIMAQYGEISDVIAVSNTDANGGAAERIYNIKMPNYTARAAVRMSIKDGTALLSQLIVGGEQDAETIKALTEAYYSVSFN